MVQRMLERAAKAADKKKAKMLTKKKSHTKKSARKQIGSVGKPLGKINSIPRSNRANSVVA